MYKESMVPVTPHKSDKHGQKGIYEVWSVRSRLNKRNHFILMYEFENTLN